MGETFYSVLGVDADADRETVRRAYREHVKEAHPDVSDSPDAGEQFKRLTTARDVLVDEGERRRYDRLGHDAYVQQHVQTSAWSVPDPDEPERATTTQEDVPSESATADSAATTRERTASHGGQRGAARGAGARSRTDGGYGNADWQTASEAYRRTPMDDEVGRSSLLERAVGATRKLGPWVFVYLTLLVSTVATGWFFYATSRYVELSLPLIVSGAVVVLLILCFSMVHMILELSF